MLRPVLATAFFFALAPYPAIGQAGEPKESETWKAKKNGPEPLTITLDWSRNEREGKVPERITPKRRLSWRVTRFNFIRYEPEVSVDAKAVPGYALLEGLWAQVLSLEGVVPSRVGEAGNEMEILGKQSPFLAALEDWRANLVSNASLLRRRVDSVTKVVALAQADSSQIARYAGASRDALKVLEKNRSDTELLIYRQYAVAMTDQTEEYLSARAEMTQLETTARVADSVLKVAEARVATARTDAARSQAESQRSEASDAALAARAKLTEAKVRVDRFGAASTLTDSPIAEAFYARALYDAQLVPHNSLVAKLNEFVRRADESIKGRSGDLESQKAGTIVTVTAKVKSIGESPDEVKNAAAAKPFTVTYYVQSDMPVVFHAGIAYTNLKSFDYQVVQKNLTGDVFQQIQKPDASVDLTAFMTYLFTPLADDWKGGFGLSLGTGVKELGKKLFVGATLKFSDRLLLTGGGFSQAVTDSAGVALSASPKLFDSIKRVQKWGWFGSVSATPF
jgi:hypothetical protein